MPAQLDWHVGDDSKEWLPLEPAPPPPPPWHRRVLVRIPRWVWAALLVAALAAALGGTLSVHRRYRRAMEQIQFQIQTVIDLEASAFERRDRERIFIRGCSNPDGGKEQPGRFRFRPARR